MTKKRGYGLYSSVSCAMNVLYMLLNGQIGEHNPFWQEFGLTDFRVVPGKFHDDSSDGACGLEDLHWTERDFDVYVNDEYIASISVWNCGRSTPFGGWYPEHIRYRPVKFSQPDEVQVGKKEWKRELSERTTRSVPLVAHLGDWKRIDHGELESIRKERIA